MTLLGLAFFLSGAAALVYQVVWQRILTLHTGIGVVSVSLIVASFMAGLGLGSQLGRRPLRAPRPRARRLRPSRSSSSAVGLFAAVSCRLFHDGFGVVAAGLYRTTAGSALAHFAAFLVPTTLMGMSLPFLVQGHGARHRHGLARDRRALRHQRARRRLRGPARALGARALPRDGRRGAARARSRTCWPRRRRCSPRAAGLLEGAALPAAPPLAPRPRPRRRLVRALPAALRPVGLPGALARDPLVPGDGRRRQEHRLHLRHRARALPARPRRRQPRRRPARGAPRAARSRRSSTASCCCSSAAGGALALVAWLPPGRRSTAGSSSTGARRASSTSAPTGTRRRCCASTRSCRSRSSGCRRCSWASRSRPCSARSRTTRRRAAARSGCCRRPTSSAAPPAACSRASCCSSGWARRAACACCSREAGSCSCCCGRASRARARGLWARAAALLLVLLALPSNDALWRRLHGIDRAAVEGLHRRGRERRERHVPGTGRALARDGQRPAAQLAALRGHPHAARRAAGGDPPGARGDRRDRPRLGRDRLGGRLPPGDEAACASSRSPRASRGCCSRSR